MLQSNNSGGEGQQWPKPRGKASLRRWHWSWDLMVTSAPHQLCDLRLSPSLFVKHLGWTLPPSFPKPLQFYFSTDWTRCRPITTFLSSFVYTYFIIMKKKQPQQKKRFQFSTFCAGRTIWQNSQKPHKYESNNGPPIPWEDIQVVCGSLPEPKPNALQSLKNYWKTAHTCSELLWSFKVYTK